MSIEDEMVELMDIFSRLTQSTLSAFHKAGIDADLSKNMDNLKLYIVNEIKPRKLVSFTPNGDDMVERLFTDGYTDIVEFEDVYSKSFPTPDFNEDMEKIYNRIENKKYTPFVSIKRGKIDTCEWRDISNLSEASIFTSYDN